MESIPPVDDAQPRTREPDVGKWLGDAWNVLSAGAPGSFGAGFLIAAAMALLALPGVVASSYFNLALTQEVGGHDYQTVIAGMQRMARGEVSQAFISMAGYTQMMTLMGAAVETLLRGLVLGAGYLYFIELRRHGRASWASVFACLRADPTSLVLVGVVGGILIHLGALLCCLPGAFLWIAWLFAVPLVADRGLNFWDAMEASWNAALGDLRVFFFGACVGALYLAAGIVAFFFGTGICSILSFITHFLAVSFALASVSCAYEDLLAHADLRTSPRKVADAIGFLATNLAVIPGVGTFMGGMRVTGALQVLIAVAGEILTLLGFFPYMVRYFRGDAEFFNDPDLVRALSGVGLFVAAWLWGLAVGSWMVWRAKAEVAAEMK
jgi:uncharacterized membrane protein